jgi:8-oxo-dGTP pyrophosphatase MutT (NUDIX family)
LDVEKIEEKVKEALKEGKAVAIRIGIFGAILMRDGKILLRRREEKGSIAGADLSGKWELPGGTIELSDLGEDYQGAIKSALKREIKEETGLEIDMDSIPIVVLLPAVLKKSSIEKRNLIDWAFVVPISAGSVRATSKYFELEKNKEIAWIEFEGVKKIEIVGERMKYLVNIAINYYLISQ